MTEVWKVYKVTSYRNQFQNYCYEISSEGRIKINGELVEPFVQRNGYRKIAGKYLHKLVAELFVPNPDNKSEVDHINTDKSDNRACNLRWVTHEENCNNNFTLNHLQSKCGGTLNGMYGKKHSSSTKQKMSNLKKGRHWKHVDGKRIWYD